MRSDIAKLLEFYVDLKTSSEKIYALVNKVNSNSELFKNFIEFNKGKQIEENAMKTVKQLNRGYGDLCYIHAAGLLVLNLKSEYNEYIKSVNSAHLFPYSINIFDSKDGVLLLNYINCIISQSNEFKKEHYFQKWMINSFRDYEKLTGDPTSVIREYNTGYGFCDVFCQGKNSVYIELKVKKLHRKDVYQTYEYFIASKKKINAVLIGHSCPKDVEYLANELGVSVYTYSIVEIFPTRVAFKHICGKKIAKIESLPSLPQILIESYDKALNYYFNEPAAAAGGA